MNAKPKEKIRLSGSSFNLNSNAFANVKCLNMENCDQIFITNAVTCEDGSGRTVASIKLVSCEDDY